MSDFAPGFLLGLSLIVPIGAQNAFVLRQGLIGLHVFPVCLACALSDAALIPVGVFMLDRVAAATPGILPILRYAGATFLFVYGLRSARVAIRGESALRINGMARGRRRTLATCLALTWLNPHVYLDTVLLVGSIATQYSRPVHFAAGAVSASFVFFFALGYGARLLRPVFARPGAWRILEALIALVMWSIAVKLLAG